MLPLWEVKRLGLMVVQAELVCQEALSLCFQTQRYSGLMALKHNASVYSRKYM